MHKGYLVVNIRVTDQNRFQQSLTITQFKVFNICFFTLMVMMKMELSDVQK
jgi:hypothetical protein